MRKYVEIVNDRIKEYKKVRSEIEAQSTGPRETEKIKEMKRHIEKLKEELTKIDLKAEPEIAKEYENKIEDEQKLLKAEIENEQKNRGKIYTEQEKKVRLMENEDSIRKFLTQEKKFILQMIDVKGQDMKFYLDRIKNFKYQYKVLKKGTKIKNGTKTKNGAEEDVLEEDMRIPTNGEEYKKLNEKINELQDEIKDLKEAKILCEKALDKFKEKDEQRVSKINDILKETYTPPTPPAPTRQDFEKDKIIKTDVKRLPWDTKVIIGRKGKVSYDGKNYRIPAKALREGMGLVASEVTDILKKSNIDVLRPEVLEEGLKSKMIDPMIINAICNAKGRFFKQMSNVDKSAILNRYLADCMNAKYNNDPKNNCNIEYDQEDLSKSNLIKGFFDREMDFDEKLEMVKRAKKATRFNIGKTKGEYKPNRLSRFLARITKQDIPMLPPPLSIEEQMEVATKYNQWIDEGKKLKREDFMNDINVDLGEKGVHRLSDNQKEELKELAESQETQGKGMEIGE